MEAVEPTLLQTWREKNKRSLKSVADEAGVSEATWSRWETGYRRVPAEQAQTVERVTGIPCHALRPDVFPASKPRRTKAEEALAS